VSEPVSPLGTSPSAHTLPVTTPSSIKNHPGLRDSTLAGMDGQAKSGGKPHALQSGKAAGAKAGVACLTRPHA